MLRSYGAKGGFTLIELLVALAILSILAAAAIPFAEVTVIRTKELELRSALREVRSAIDAFHEDWDNGKISRTGNASADGYPRSLRILVEGAERGGAETGKRRYLRRIPRDPFSDRGTAPDEGWAIRGYQDELSASTWSGVDVYDIRSLSDKTALDGTYYRDW